MRFQQAQTYARCDTARARKVRRDAPEKLSGIGLGTPSAGSDCASGCALGTTSDSAWEKEYARDGAAAAGMTESARIPPDISPRFWCSHHTRNNRSRRNICKRSCPCSRRGNSLCPSTRHRSRRTVRLCLTPGGGRMHRERVGPQAPEIPLHCQTCGTQS